MPPLTLYHGNSSSSCGADRCPDCGCRTLREVAGYQLTCMDCGLVLDEFKLMATDPTEYSLIDSVRAESSSAAAAAGAEGGASVPASGAQGQLGTKQVGRQMQQQVTRLPYHHQQQAGAPSAAAQKDAEWLRAVSIAMGMEHLTNVTSNAKLNFQDFVAKTKTQPKGGNRNLLMAACAFHAQSAMNGGGRTQNEWADTLSLERGPFLKACAIVERVLGAGNTKTCRPEDLLRRFVRKLGLAKHQEDQACGRAFDLLDLLSRDHAFTKYTPEVLAACVIYRGCELARISITMTHFCGQLRVGQDKAVVSPTTIIDFKRNLAAMARRAA